MILALPWSWSSSSPGGLDAGDTAALTAFHARFAHSSTGAE